MNTIMQAISLMENNQTKEAINLLESYLPEADEEEKVYHCGSLYTMGNDSGSNSHFK